MQWRHHATIGGAALVLALAALFTLRSGSELHPPYPKARATAAALRDPAVKSFVSGSGWTKAGVIALDDGHWRVTFWDGPRVVLDASVDGRGQVVATQLHAGALKPPGSAVLWSPALLVVLAALFAAVLAVRPLRSIRNLDAAVLGGGLTLSAALLEARLVSAHVYAGIATLAYIAFRCAQVGLGRPAQERPAQPLLSGAAASRSLRLVAAAALAGAVTIVVTSTGISDVAFAGMLGATKLNHGTLPYGALSPEVVHGDTYPLLTYLLYSPFAALTPVHSAFDSLDGSLVLNAIALVVTAGLLYRLRRGLDHALAWLLFPPVLLAASGGGNDVPTAMFVAGALVLFARPVASAGMLALAGWAKLAPAAALVVWLARLRGCALAQACGAAAAVGVLALAVIVAFGDVHALRATWDAIHFQFERGSFYSLWQQTGARDLQVVFQALTVAFAVVVAVEVRRRGAGGIGLRRAAALAAVLLVLIQIGANYWTFAYIPWVVPLILVALFPPTLPRSPQPARPAP
ncbi:MAG: hypothetical protein QOH13_467 [Thermoleophilaceae bacterium]|nr:hypothetical protein [Thermoleophilaceae bacterium]